MYVHMPSRPAAIPPGPEKIIVAAQVRHRIKTSSAKRLAPQQPGQNEPEPAPGAILINCLKGIFGTCRQMSAWPAEPWFERHAVEVHRRLDQPTHNSSSKTKYARWLVAHHGFVAAFSLLLPLQYSRPPHPRADQSPFRWHQKSAVSTHAGPCTAAPAPATRDRSSALLVAGLPVSTSPA